MRVLVIGALAGVGLSMWRAPLGVELLQLAGTTAESAVAFRAAGLALAALVAWMAAPRFERAGLGTRWIVGLALGFTVHGLVLGWSPPSHRGLVGAALGLAFVALLAGRAGVSNDDDRDEREPPPKRHGSVFGTACVGAGVAVALECAARSLRWFGGGTAADDALFTASLLVPAALFALFFAPAASSSRAAKLLRALGAQGSAIGALAAATLVAGFLDPRRLGAHLARFDIDTSEHGMLAFGAVIAVPALAVAALGLGALAAGTRRRASIVALLAGAAVGTAAFPRAFAPDSPFLAEDAFPLARAAAALACVGALFVLFVELDDDERAWPRLVAGLPAVALALYLPVPRPAMRASWTMVEPQVLYEAECAEGRLTVEVRDDRGVVCLDGRPVTPLRDRREAERRLIHAAWAGRAEGTGPRVLFVGQLDAGRAAALLEVGARVVDRCSAWSEHTQRLEEHAFAWEGANPPAGDRLSVAEARAKLAAGEYDWVYAAPHQRVAAGTRQLGGVPGVGAAVAFSGDTPIAARGLGATIVPVQTGLEQLDVIVFGGPHADLGAAGVTAGPAERAEAPWRSLSRRTDERPRENRARLAERLARANESTPAAHATRALALQVAAQRRSSPFESPAQRVEIPADAFAAWRDAGLEDEPGPLARAALNDLAALCVEKRLVAEAIEFLTPVADRHWPWPTLERALALCQWELLDLDAALERYEPFAEEGGVRGRDWWLLAALQAQAGRSGDARESANRARADGARAPEWEAAYQAAVDAREAGPGPEGPAVPPVRHGSSGSPEPHDHDHDHDH